MMPLCVVAMSASVALGQYLPVTAYQSFADSPFAGISFDTFHNETFEDGLLNTPGLSASGGLVTVPGVSVDSVDGDDGALDGSGSGGRSWYSSGTLSAITFTFDPLALGSLPTHAGLVWTDVGFTTGALGVGSVTFEAFDALGVSLGVFGPTVLGDGSVLGQTAEDRFFGVVHAGGISAIKISMLDSSDWEVDHVQYGIIPSPGAVALAALAPLALRRRR